MKLSLSLNTKLSVLTALLLPVLLLLGNWQLQRAEEKRTIEATVIARQQQAPVALGELKKGSDLAFSPVRLNGQFDDRHQFLLDNRMHGGRLGYEVLTPLQTESGDWALVNRGWIQAKPKRQHLPPIPTIEGVVHTTGTVYVPLGEPFLLAEQTFQDVEWPLVVQAVELEKFAALLGRELFPHVVRLDEGARGALEIDWQPINVQPEKHTAYAVQWFAMAAALMLWFLFANTNVWQMLRAGSGRS